MSTTKAETKKTTAKTSQISAMEVIRRIGDDPRSQNCFKLIRDTKHPTTKLLMKLFSHQMKKIENKQQIKKQLKIVTNSKKIK